MRQLEAHAGYTPRHALMLPLTTPTSTFAAVSTLGARRRSVGRVCAIVAGIMRCGSPRSGGNGDAAGITDDVITIVCDLGPRDVAAPGLEVVVVDVMTGFGLVTIMATLGGPAHLARAETANTRPTTGASVRHVVRRFHTAAADVKPPRPPSNATPDGRLAAYRARARDVGFPRGRGWWPEGIRAGISYRNWHTIRSSWLA